MIWMWLTIFRYRISSRNNNTQLINSLLDPFFLSGQHFPTPSESGLAAKRAKRTKKEGRHGRVG